MKAVILELLIRALMSEVSSMTTSILFAFEKILKIFSKKL